MIAMPVRHQDLPPIEDTGSLDQAIETSPALLVYLTGPDCAVCAALRPRVAALIACRFPRMRGLSLDCSTWPAVAARHQVFTVPTVLGFFNGREWVRKSRRLALTELEAALARPYHLLFDETE